MVRVEIQMPEVYEFVTTIRLRVNDLNYGNHLSNDKVITLAHEARMQFLQSMGYAELDIEGRSIIQIDTAALYRSEGFYGNEIKIEVAIRNLGTSSFDLFYRMTNQTTQKPLADVKTGMVFYDYDEGKPIPMPDGFRNRFI